MLSRALPTDVVREQAAVLNMFASRLLCWCRSGCVVLLFALIIGAKWRAYATWMEISCIFSM
jgi:hypothetical protein